MPALSPILNIINTFFALPLDKSTDRVLNIFSVTSGFMAPFNFSFIVNVGRNGRLYVKGGIKRTSSEIESFRGTLNIQVEADGTFESLNVSLVGSDNLITSDNQRDRLIQFERTGTGRVQFTPVRFTLISRAGKQIPVDISGDGMGDFRVGACLLGRGSLLISGHRYAISMGSQGYCQQDCRGDNSCSLFCVDKPIYKNSGSGALLFSFCI